MNINIENIWVPTRKDAYKLFCRFQWSFGNGYLYVFAWFIKDFMNGYLKIELQKW
jgi:hypothetical protein